MTEEKVSHAPVIIYSILAIFLIGYGIYMYFAVRNSYWPFHVYIVNTSDNIVQPNGNVSYDYTSGKVFVNGEEDDDAVISEDDAENLKAIAESMQQTNCTYYAAEGYRLFPLPKGQKLIGDCDDSKT